VAGVFDGSQCFLAEAEGFKIHVRCLMLFCLAVGPLGPGRLERYLHSKLEYHVLAQENQHKFRSTEHHPMFWLALSCCSLGGSDCAT
ncbi:MAG: hypothetical protein QF670_12795, partial [Alphaproteobacteria bacterium]|nr:hypothetical protein [Alphaproteobacteria bacterium]